MKNSNFYNVVSKTKLLDTFKKNKVMFNTYFGLASEPTNWALDFSNPETQQEFVNAPVYGSSDFEPGTLYRRNEAMIITPLELGTIILGDGSGSSGRAGYRYVFPEVPTGKVITVEHEFKINKATEEPTYASTTNLYSIFFANPNSTTPFGISLSPANINVRNSSGSDSVNYAWPEGLSIYDHLTVKMEYNDVTKICKYYLNDNLLHTTPAIETAEAPYGIMPSGASNVTAQNQTNITLYSVDITVSEV